MFTPYCSKKLIVKCDYVLQQVQTLSYCNSLNNKNFFSPITSIYLLFSLQQYLLIIHIEYLWFKHYLANRFKFPFFFFWVCKFWEYCSVCRETLISRFFCKDSLEIKTIFVRFSKAYQSFTIFRLGSLGELCFSNAFMYTKRTYRVHRHVLNVL